jgi:DNA-directed RNA polymerase specialized sigma subunit
MILSTARLKKKWKKTVISAMGTLSPRETVIMDLRTLNNSKEKPKKEVAEILGISQSYIQD